MDEQFDLAGAVAVILGFHLQEIRSAEGLGVKSPGNLEPGLQTAWKLWTELKPYTGDSGLLQPQVQAFSATPGPDTRMALADRLRQIFGVERAFEGRLDDIVMHSSYASLYHPEHMEQPPVPDQPSPVELPAPNRTLMLAALVILYFLVWAASSIASANKALIPFLAAFVIRALGTGYFASRLRVPRGWWMALGGLIPGNALMTLFALIGYRLEDDGSGPPKVYYTTTMRVLLLFPLAAPVLLTIVLTIISPPYMVQLFNPPVGLALLAITLALFGVLGVSVWFGFWKGKASSGISISLAATAASWCAMLLIWLVLLGPAFVHITQQFPELLPQLLNGDFSALQPPAR